MRNRCAFDPHLPRPHSQRPCLTFFIPLQDCSPTGVRALALGRVSTQDVAMDPFIPALEELSQALAAGEDPDQAHEEIADEHGLAAHALRNRAVRAFGTLETYKERQAD